MTKRYQMGFDEGVRCMLADDNPDLFPVVDTGHWNICGSLVALCHTQQDAERVVDALNGLHRMEQNVKQG